MNSCSSADITATDDSEISSHQRLVKYSLHNVTSIAPPRSENGRMVRTLLNILWVVLGGFPMALAWWLVSLICAVTIIGLPWARSCWVIGRFSLWPFGHEAVSRRNLDSRGDLGTGPLGLIGNVIWFLVAGWWLAIGHLSSALACFVTIIGIPFGVQHIKLAVIALAPVGMAVVESQDIRPGLQPARKP